MATMSNLFRRILRRSLKPRNTTFRRKFSPLSQVMDQFELELRWVPAILTPAPGVGTISALTVNPGDEIQLSTGTYFDFVVIDDASVTLHALPGNSPVIAAPLNDVTEQLGNGSGHLVSVLASDVTIANITFNGSGLLFAGNATSSVNIGSTPIWASKGISNSLAPGGGVSIGNLTITNNVFQNLGGDAISLNSTVSGGVISNNTIGTYGGESCLSPWAAIFLGDNSMANVTNNNINTTSNNYGIQVDNIGASDNACFSNNTISVAQGSIGITINLTYTNAGDITVANNTISAASGVTSSTPFRTRGINLFSIYSGAVSLNNNVINGPGTFDRGIDIWNVGPNASITGGSVSNAAVGLKVDGVDPYYGAGGGTTLSVANATITGSIGLQVLNQNTAQFPASPILEGRNADVTSNVTVTVTNGAVNSTVVSGNAIVIASNANATFEARVVANGSLSIGGGIQRTGDMAIFQDNRSPKRYDFGSGPTLAGYLGVPGTAIYSASAGYGFSTTLSTWNTAAAPITNALTQDGVRGGALANGAANTTWSPANANGTFRVDLGAGNYTVTAFVGSRVAFGGYNKSTIVEAIVGNTVVATYSANTTYASPFASGNLSSTLTLGAATTVEFRMRAPLGFNWAVNGLTITAVP